MTGGTFAVKNKRLFLSTDSGIKEFDVEDPFTPKIMWALEKLGNIDNMDYITLEGSILCFQIWMPPTGEQIDYGRYLYTYDIEDVDHPRFIARHKLAKSLRRGSVY
jgi:hypothetical protein